MDDALDRGSAHLRKTNQTPPAADSPAPPAPLRLAERRTVPLLGRGKAEEQTGESKQGRVLMVAMSEAPPPRAQCRHSDSAPGAGGAVGQLQPPFHNTIAGGCLSVVVRM